MVGNETRTPLRLVPFAKSARQLDYIISGLSFVRWIGRDHPGAVKSMRPSFAVSSLADRQNATSSPRVMRYSWIPNR
jgi:hypothetical protein